MSALKLKVLLLLVKLFAVQSAQADELPVAYQDWNGPVYALEQCSLQGCLIEGSAQLVPRADLIQQLPVVASVGCYETGGICVLKEGHPYGVTAEAKHGVL